ncbi:MAG: ATP-dependent Clp protease ATP-binding subunit ClpC [Candidatus Binatota bacterium]|jgi:ATP-dependent Clp protease ATP-binding subunit ClpC|nr:ATP-dependent Clp protease ATP-binding subunit ClpC [Candidatus Binatota bacterium]
MTDLAKITDLEKLKELLGKQQSGARRVIDEAEMRAALRGRVKGQDHVIDDVTRLIRLQWGKAQRKRPIANLLFLGPTGTGKTELAKVMAEYLYGDERNMLRFDMGEFKGTEGVTRLIGSPLGYVGSQQGGQLTRAVLNNPKRLVLFDEIEKAVSEVFDVFLQMMGDGRLTEAGSGKVADFTQSIIILTSNAESDAIGKLQEQIADYHEMVNAVKSHLADTKVFRAEIVGRIDRVYVFQPLEGLVVADIAAQKMENLAKEYELELAYVDPQFIVEAMSKGNKLSKFGVRELDRVINEMLGESMLAAKEAGVARVRLFVDEDGTMRIGAADEEGPVAEAAAIEIPAESDETEEPAPRGGKGSRGGD